MAREGSGSAGYFGTPLAGIVLPWFPRSVRGNLLVLLLVLLVPLLVLQAAISYRDYQGRLAQQLGTNLEVARATGVAFDGYVGDVVHEELALGTAVASASPRPPDVNAYLKVNADQYPSIREFFWTDPSGKITGSSNPAILGVDVTDRDYFQAVTSGKEWMVSDMLQTKVGSEPAFVVARGVWDGSGRLLGIMGATVLPDKLGGALPIERAGDSAIAIIDRQGLLVFRNPQAQLTWEQRSSTQQQPMVRRSLGGEEAAGVFVSELDGQERSGGFAPIQSVGWVARASQPTLDVTAPLLRDILEDAALFTLISLGAFAAAWLISRRITLPLDQLGRQAAVIASGRPSVQVKVAGPAEMEHLAGVFNHMSGEIRLRQDELTRINERLQDQAERLQTQNEELQSQSEEIQSQNEELQSQSEEIQSQNEEMAEQNHQLATQARRLARLQEIALRLSRSLSPNEVLGQVLKAASDLTGSSLASVFLLDESEETFSVAASVGLEGDQEDLRWLTREESLAGRALAEGRTIPVEDVSGQTNIRFPLLAGGRALGSIIVSPMIVQGEALGVVEVYYSEPRTFSASDVEMMSALSSAAAVAVYNSRLFEETVRQKQALLESQELQARLAAIVESSEEAIIGKSLDGTVTSWNPAAERLYGYRAEEMIGRTLSIVMPPDRLAELSSNLEQVGRGELVEPYDTVRAAKDGRLIDVSVTVSPIRDASGAVVGASTIAHDIGERKRAEEERRLLLEEMQHRAAELDAANKELEAFSYSVSHDLRAPLRTIDGFSKALLEDYAELLDEDGKGYLNWVRMGSQRMGRLIDDMLALSRVTRSEMRREKVDLSEVAREVASELRQAQPERNVGLSIAPGVVAQGDPHLLRLVMQNLLGNAWKFTSKREDARIEFGTVDSDGQRAYFVCDNGVGFDMAYIGKLFGAFQRLHSDEEFPGTGIGLATVQRILRRHGGRIWAEATVDRGATFYFTLDGGQ